MSTTIPSFSLCSVLHGSSSIQYRAFEVSYSNPETLTLLSFDTVPDDTLETETEPVPPMPPPALGLGLHEVNAGSVRTMVSVKAFTGDELGMNPLK